MELRGPDGAPLGAILKMDHPQATWKTSAGEYLRSRYMGKESDTFLLQHGKVRAATASGAGLVLS